MGYVTDDGGRAVVPMARRAARRRAASCSRTAAGSRSRARAIRRRSCAAGSRRSGPVVRATTRLLLRARAAKGRSCAPASTAEPRGAAAAAGAHSSLHARPASQRDRAGDGQRIPAVPRVLAARRRRVHARRAARRGGGAARSSRASRCRRAAWEAHVLPRARARLSARVARRADAVRRVRVGPALGRRRQRDPHHADRFVPREDTRRLAGA